MRVIIDGLDITKFIVESGIKWTRNDVDGPNAGRTLDGVMHRDRVGTKIRLDITCRTLHDDDLKTLLNALYPEYVSVSYYDPMYGQRTATFYSNNNPATLYLSPDGKDGTWQSITFPLVEQ